MKHLAFILMVCLGTAHAQESQAGNYKELNRRVKDRYDGKVFLVARDGLIAGEYRKNALGGGTPGMSYHYFHESVTELPKHVTTGQIVSKSLAQMNRVDDRTFNDVTLGLNITKLAKGEQVRISKFYMRGNYVELFLEPLSPEHLSDLDISKASKRSTTLIGGGRTQQDVTVAGFGVRFLFYFDKGKVLDAGDFTAVTAGIDRFFLLRRDSGELNTAANSVDIEIGDSEEAVTRKLGQPLKAIRVGTQKLLSYRDFTIVLKDGKVAEVKMQ